MMPRCLFQNTGAFSTLSITYKTTNTINFLIPEHNILLTFSKKFFCGKVGINTLLKLVISSIRQRLYQEQKLGVSFQQFYQQAA